MNERRKRIEELAARYFEARTTDAEERELRELSRVGDSGMTEELRVLFGGLDALAGERMPVERETAVGRLSAAEQGAAGERPHVPTGSRSAGRQLRMPGSRMPLRRSVRRFVPWWGVAAVAAVALGAFLCVELLREPYCYIDGRAVYDRETAMRTTAYLGSFAVLESPGRIVDDLLENR